MQCTVPVVLVALLLLSFPVFVVLENTEVLETSTINKYIVINTRIENSVIFHVKTDLSIFLFDILWIQIFKKVFL